MLGVQRRRPYGLEPVKRRQPAVVFLERLRHSRLIWSRPDIIGLLSNNVGSWPLLVKVAKGPKLGGIPSRGGEALHPPKKTDAHAGFTKSGQEP